ncbi:UNVERIFIED_CONTAM: Polygalacturonase [Sesamum radiatum]|uniref:Polygalacturonase n=1 Tax=Sesamum radiatum TaxID=300843 RepID=A0AAW2V364_SESRA
MDAWKEASNSTSPSIIVIPRGTWSLSQVKLIGNKAPLELQVQGTVQANPKTGQLPNKDGEWITINYYVNYFTLSGGGVFDGQGQEAWKQNDCHKNRNCAKLPMNLSFNFINNSIIRDVTTKDSKNFHVNCISSHNVTFLRFTISAPGDSPNTDGDDCVSIGDETKEVRIQNVTCGPGHGISVGSLGGYAEEKDVQGIYVKNCTFIGTQNGVRVKTWPSAPAQLTVSDLHFEDLIMDNRPSSIKITNVSIKNVRGTTNSAEAVTLICSSLKPCENVEGG